MFFFTNLFTALATVKEILLDLVDDWEKGCKQDIRIQ